MGAVNFTSSLPEEVLARLDAYARSFKVPKNQIIEMALNDFFDRLKKAEYTYSFKRASSDAAVISMAEEGLEDYLKILDEE